MTVLKALELWKKECSCSGRELKLQEVFERHFQHENPRKTSLFFLFGLPTSSELADPDVHDSLRAGIADAVKSLQNGKNNAVVAFRRFVDFLNDRCGVNLHVAFPKVNISNSLERQLEIVKLLQEGDLTIAEVADLLWVDVRTIENDLACLSFDEDNPHNIHEPIEVLGQRFSVDYDRSKGRLAFPTKVHPFFLASNITQVIAMLEGLRMMSRKPGWEGYATLQAASIWSQISDPGKKRIHDVSSFLAMDIAWYDGLENVDDRRMFRDEATCSYDEACGNLLNFMKNGTQCDLLYRDEAGDAITVTNCRIIDERDGVTIQAENQTRVLPKDSIIAIRKNVVVDAAGRKKR